MMSFFFLNRGCQHWRSANYLSLGVLDSSDAIDPGEPCNQCPICSGDWFELHVPVYREQLVRFFQSSTGRCVLPMPVDNKDLANVSQILKKRPYWVEWIFDRAHRQVSKRCIDGLMLSLIASNIIRLKSDGSGKLSWDLGWINESTPVFLNDDAWAGVNLYDEDRCHSRRVVLSDITV